MKKTIAILLAGCFLLEAQEPVAPASGSAFSERGDTIDGYSVTQSFEAGYRFRSLDGSLPSYQSQVNFGSGIRLLGASVGASSAGGHGHWFDQLTLRAEGLGNDPYQLSSARIEKNGWYEYNFRWRLNQYVNPGLTTSSGLHSMDVSRRLQDHDLVLLPQSWIHFLAGYSRNTEDGPALTTLNDFNAGADPLFADVRRAQNEFRAGVLFDAAGWKISVLRAWEEFREDSTFQSIPASSGGLQSTEPFHGETASWRAFASRSVGGWLSVNARLAYAISRRGFTLDEAVGGAAGLSHPARQIVVGGNGQRPVTAANLNLVFSPAERLTITNQTSFDQIRMSGDNIYREFSDVSLSFTDLNFQLLGIRRVSNATDAVFRLHRGIGVTAGYHVAARRIRSIQEVTFSGEPAGLQAETENTQHEGVAGLRLGPMKFLSLNLDAQIGRNDRPVYPVSDKNYHALGGRVQFKRESLLVAATARTNYNFNSVAISAFSSRVRNYGLEGSWSPRSWFGIDATYSKLHTDTLGGLVYFSNAALVASASSAYISNIHFANAVIHLAAKEHAEFYLAFSRVEDTGDGRAKPAADASAFEQAQTFPLTYDAPSARVSVPLTSHLRFNAGWQFYRYREEFLQLRNYRAHTGFISLTWSF